MMVVRKITPKVTTWNKQSQFWTDTKHLHIVDFDRATFTILVVADFTQIYSQNIGVDECENQTKTQKFSNCEIGLILIKPLSLACWPGRTYRIQARRHGGAFRGRAPKSLLVPPKREICLLPSEDCAPKESNRPSAIGVHFRKCAPPKHYLCPSPQTSVKYRSRTKNSSKR